MAINPQCAVLRACIRPIECQLDPAHVQWSLRMTDNILIEAVCMGKTKF